MWIRQWSFLARRARKILGSGIFIIGWRRRSVSEANSTRPGRHWPSRSGSIPKSTHCHDSAQLNRGALPGTGLYENTVNVGLRRAGFADGMTVTRRLAAVLAADVAGYSRLMGVDEEGTHERLKAHLQELVNPKIAEHRGRIVKNTGDGFLAEFPSVVDAVR